MFRIIWPKKSRPAPVMLFQDPGIGMALAKRISERVAKKSREKKDRPVGRLEDRYYA